MTLLWLLSVPAACAHEARIDAGVYSSGYNVFRVPNLGGTKVAFTARDREGFYRVTALVQVSDSSYIRLMAMPLEQTFQVTPGQPLVFHERVFAAGEQTEVYYKFGSYRASYLYRFRISEGLLGQVGGVAKLRVAKIALRAASGESEYANVGFVPLLNLGLGWRFAPSLEARLDLDGAAARNGRAIDAAAELFYETGSKGSGVSGGVRLLEGGADSSVYTFALFHFLYLGYTQGF